jgi:hypothetical protein
LLGGRIRQFNGCRQPDLRDEIPQKSRDLKGDYQVELVVNDGSVDSEPDTVIISAGNSIPIANAGMDMDVVVDELATLDGSGSTDIDGDSLSYSWSLIEVPAGSTAVLSDTTAVMPTMLIDLHLLIRDNEGLIKCRTLPINIGIGVLNIRITQSRDTYNNAH